MEIKTEKTEHILPCLSSSPSNAKIIKTASQRPEAFKKIRVPSLVNILTMLAVLIGSTCIGYVFHRLNFTEANIITIYILGTMLTALFTKNYICSTLENDVASLRVFMATLRKKLESGKGSSQYIQTHIGIGYRMMKLE